MKAEIREERRKKLMESRLYQLMEKLTVYLDRYFLDALIGLIPGWGDFVSFLFVLPYLYFSLHVIKSIPLTLAILNNALRDVLLGMIPFFVGDFIDAFHRSNIQNMQMIQGFVDGDEKMIRKVNQKAIQAVAVMVLLIALIIAMVWLLAWLINLLISLWS